MNASLEEGVGEMGEEELRFKPLLSFILVLYLTNSRMFVASYHIVAS
jgi:hypothetical protein